MMMMMMLTMMMMSETCEIVVDTAALSLEKKTKQNQMTVQVSVAANTRVYTGSALEALRVYAI